MKNQVLIAALIAAAASVSDAFSVAPAARSSAPSVAGTISHHGDLRIASRSQFASKVVFVEGGSSAPFKNRRSHRGHRRVRAGLLHTLPQHEDAPLEVPSQDNDETFDVKTTATLIGGQSVLIVIAAAAAAIAPPAHTAAAPTAALAKLLHWRGSLPEGDARALNEALEGGVRPVAVTTQVRYGVKLRYGAKHILPRQVRSILGLLPQLNAAIT